jgi:hypothetical protein
MENHLSFNLRVFLAPFGVMRNATKFHFSCPEMILIPMELNFAQ